MERLEEFDQVEVPFWSVQFIRCRKVEQRSIKVIRIKSLLIMVDYLSNYEKKVYQFNRSSHRRCTVKKGVVRNFVKFTGKHLCRGLFLIKLQAWGLQLYKKETPAQVFSCKFCKISKKYFFYTTPLDDCFWFNSIGFFDEFL